MDGTLGIFFLSAVELLLHAVLIPFPIFLPFVFPYFVLPPSLQSRNSGSTPRITHAQTHQPTRFAYSPHVLLPPALARGRDISAYTRLDYGSLPAATHRPTWSRSSTSPTMMCVYRVLPWQKTNPNIPPPTTWPCPSCPSLTSIWERARALARARAHTYPHAPKMRISDLYPLPSSRSTSSARSPPRTSSTTSSPTS